MVAGAESSTEEQYLTIAQHLDELVREFEALPLPKVQEQVFDLLQTVDALHRQGLSRLLAILREHDQGTSIERAAADPIVRTLLLLYDLHPSDPLTLAETALEVHESAPAPPPVANFIPRDRIGRAQARSIRRPIFAKVARLEEVPPGAMKECEVDGVRVLLTNVAGEVYAVRNHCPSSAAPLNLGVFTPPILICPWHNEAFDVRTGKRVDGLDGPGLAVLPIAVRDGVIELAINTLPDGARLTVRSP